MRASGPDSILSFQSMLLFLGCILISASSVSASASASASAVQASSSSSRSLQAGVTPNPFVDGTDPVWWESYRTKYGKRAKKCVDQLVLPVDKTSCPRKKIGEYSCFFGSDAGQICPEDGSAHPENKCDCSANGVWDCSDYQPCGTEELPAFTTCPPKHPLTYPFKLTCDSDFLVCNYGNQLCCGEFMLYYLYYNHSNRREERSKEESNHHCQN